MTNDQAASRQDILDAEERIVRALKQYIDERCERVETKLLAAFWEWARPLEIRVRTLPGLDERVSLLEERVSRIQRGDPPLHG
jgi:hypothetical protein